MKRTIWETGGDGITIDDAGAGDGYITLTAHDSDGTAMRVHLYLDEALEVKRALDQAVATLEAKS